MWIFLNDAFFSMVDEKAKEAKGKKVKRGAARETDILVVRARLDGDLEKVFGQHFKIAGRKLEVIENGATDYRYRLRVTRKMMKEVMAAEVDRVLYGNFKDSVSNDELHTAYSQVWGVMYRLQEPTYRRTYGPDLFAGAQV